jgi:hypothetical protein
MASQAVTDAVLSRLAANWTRTPIVPPSTRSDTPAAGTPFLAVQFPFSREEQVTVGTPGANVFREEGAIRLVLAVPRNVGLSAYLGWVDELRALFRAKSFTPVKTWAPSPPVIDDAIEAGPYVLLSFAVPYYADILA